MTAPNQHSIREREDELREEFWAVAGDDLGSVATTNVARALTGLVRLLASTEEQLEAARRALRDCAALIDARYPEGTTEYQVVLLARGQKHEPEHPK